MSHREHTNIEYHPKICGSLKLTTSLFSDILLHILPAHHVPKYVNHRYKSAVPPEGRGGTGDSEDKAQLPRILFADNF
jgi:hypothetical protein